MFYPQNQILANPIPGTTKVQENIGAAEVELTTKDITDIDSALASITVHGERYPAALQKAVGK